MATVSVLASSPESRSPSSPSSEYLTKRGLADFIGRHTRTIDRWEKLKIGPPRFQSPFNRKLILYRRSSVIAWLEAMEGCIPRDFHQTRRKKPGTR